MQALTISILLALLGATMATAQEYAPFFDPVANGRSQPMLFKRQNCAAGYGGCANLGSDGNTLCCPTASPCARDAAGHIACCLTNAVCTGTIGGIAPGSTASTTALGGSTTTPFETASPVTGVAGGGSTVPNVYYPFIYIPTSYADAALCSSAWSSCQTQSTSCFSSLAGVNGVTVSGFGGGITVQGSSGTILSSASSICSTLSTSACYNLQESNCANYGSGGTTANPNSGPRPTPCPAMVYAIGAGAVVGAAGAWMQ